MIPFTFSTFVVKNENREASDLCLAVANLQPVKPQPLLLLADSGAGKTHLLCAIVNHVKKHAPRTALAYVTARDFPMAVRALAEDAGPVTRAHSAILLVDQLEKLAPDLLEILDRIAPLFLEENRYLVIAAQTDPQELPGLPAHLLSLLQSGRIARLEKAAAPAIPDPLQKQVPQLQSENQALRHELETARGEMAKLANAAEQLAHLQEQYVKTESARQHLECERAMVNESLAEQHILEQEVRSLQQVLEETRKQRDACQADSSALAAATAELARLRRQIAAGPATPERTAADSLQPAEDEIQQVRQDVKDAHDELGRWALRAQAILQQVELNRARFAENAERQLQRVLALQQQVEELTAQSNEPARPPLAAEPDGATDIARQLRDIADTAAQSAAADAETRLQTLYAQLLHAAQALQDLSDRVNDRPDAPGPAQPRPWYADPFPLPPNNVSKEPGS
ncbi:MAG TPA: DnaA/Hda family protein [Candidatus Bathyarchaeia archaeon]|nr:DnaA/Hda family protein [Candidatus Bathyarchaeia archaeon]